MILNMLNKFSGNENKKNRLDSNINILSPRLAPIMPNKAQSSTLQLSPTLFALYDNEGEEEYEIESYVQNSNKKDKFIAPNDFILQKKNLKKQKSKSNDNILNNIASVPSVSFIYIKKMIIKLTTTFFSKYFNFLLVSK